MKRWLICATLAAWPAWVWGQEQEVDQSAVLRLGEFVQHVDGTQGLQDADHIVAATSPPEDDSHKWFVSVITSEACTPCEILKNEWRTSPYLQSIANPDDAKKSWAHFNSYKAEDQSQAFRFEKIKITGYPTVIVQPPRNGKYGEPSTVVFQRAGYVAGGAEDLAKQIMDALKQYITATVGVYNGPQQGGTPWDTDGQVPVQPVLPTLPQIPPPQLQPTPTPVTPAPVTPAPKPLLGGLLGGGLLAGLLGGMFGNVLISVGFKLWDAYRTDLRKQGKEPILTDAQQDWVEDLFKRAMSKAQTPAK